MELFMKTYLWFVIDSTFLLQTMAIFLSPAVVKVNVIRSISAMVVNKENLTSLILVLQSEITSQAMKAVELWPFKVEIFQVKL